MAVIAVIAQYIAYEVTIQPAHAWHRTTSRLDELTRVIDRMVQNLENVAYLSSSFYLKVSVSKRIGRGNQSSLGRGHVTSNSAGKYRCIIVSICILANLPEASAKFSSVSKSKSKIRIQDYEFEEK